MYNNKVMELFLNPQCVGLLHGANVIGFWTDEQIGETVKIYAIINDSVFEDATFKAFGSPATIACASMICQMIKGKNFDEVAEITPEQISKELGGLPEDRIYSANLARNAVQSAIDEYFEILRKEEKRANKKGKKAEPKVVEKPQKVETEQDGGNETPEIEESVHVGNDSQSLQNFIETVKSQANENAEFDETQVSNLGEETNSSNDDNLSPADRFLADLDDTQGTQNISAKNVIDNMNIDEESTEDFFAHLDELDAMANLDDENK